jgi:hypothetical protein
LAKLRERISVSKRARQNFDLERFDIKKLDVRGVKEKYQLEILNRVLSLESLDENSDINNAWESIRENIKTTDKDNIEYQKLKHNKTWFDDKCSKLIDKRKQVKLQWLQNPSQINGNNLQNLNVKPVEHLGTRKGEYLRGRINEIETNNKNKNIRDFYRHVNKFKNGYQARINIIKDENSNLLADPRSV